jgi:hypothetical protein
MGALDLADDLFIFAQNTDNSGESDYWCSGRKLEADDPRVRSVQQAIDGTVERGVLLRTQPGCFECWTLLSGACVVKLYPSVRDAKGRASPLLLLFDLFRGGNRLSRQVEAVSDVTGRDLLQSSRKSLDWLLAWQKRPPLLIRWYVLIKKLLG